MNTDGMWDQAAELELELATLEAEIEAFRSDYLRAVGILIAEYHDVEALRREADGWAQVIRAPFESMGARVSSLT